MRNAAILRPAPRSLHHCGAFPRHFQGMKCQKGLKRSPERKQASCGPPAGSPGAAPFSPVRAAGRKAATSPGAERGTTPRRTGGDRNPANAGAPQDVLDLQHKNHLPRASGGEPVEYSQLIAAGTTPRASGDPSYEPARRGPLSNQTPQGRDEPS